VESPDQTNLAASQEKNILSLETGDTEFGPVEIRGEDLSATVLRERR
jgi:hypothetical protein